MDSLDPPPPPPFPAAPLLTLWPADVRGGEAAQAANQRTPKVCNPAQLASKTENSPGHFGHLVVQECIRRQVQKTLECVNCKARRDQGVLLVDLPASLVWKSNTDAKIGDRRCHAEACEVISLIERVRECANCQVWRVEACGEKYVKVTAVSAAAKTHEMREWKPPALAPTEAHPVWPVNARLATTQGHLMTSDEPNILDVLPSIATMIRALFPDCEESVESILKCCLPNVALNFLRSFHSTLVSLILHFKRARNVEADMTAFCSQCGTSRDLGRVIRRALATTVRHDETMALLKRTDSCQNCKGEKKAAAGEVHLVRVVRTCKSCGACVDAGYRRDEICPRVIPGQMLVKQEECDECENCVCRPPSRTLAKYQRKLALKRSKESVNDSTVNKTREEVDKSLDESRVHAPEGSFRRPCGHSRTYKELVARYTRCDTCFRAFFIGNNFARVPHSLATGNHLSVIRAGNCNECSAGAKIKLEIEVNLEVVKYQLCADCRSSHGEVRENVLMRESKRNQLQALAMGQIGFFLGPKRCQPCKERLALVKRMDMALVPKMDLPLIAISPASSSFQSVLSVSDEEEKAITDEDDNKRSNFVKVNDSK